MSNIFVESVEDAVDEYYKFKNAYESAISTNKRKIYKNKRLSFKEKRQEYQKLKPKCINCKRPGGTIFSTKNYKDNNGDEYRELKAICGIIAEPCNLNITIQLGKYQLLQDVLKEIQTEIKDEKNKIIDDKNKLLFGFINTETALEQFEQKKEAINEFSSLLEMYLDYYNKITENSERKKELETDITLSYTLIEQIKQAVIKFNETENNQYIHDVVNIYVTNLKPLLTKISALKYKDRFIYYDEKNSTYHLIENRYNIKSLEYGGSKNKVVSFDIGLQIKKEKSKVTPAKKGFIIESSSTETNNTESSSVNEFEEQFEELK